MLTEKEELEALVEAMWQLLDDMGREGNSVCRAAKAQARIAYEPFGYGELHKDWMTIEEAKSIIEECDE